MAVIIAYIRFQRAKRERFGKGHVKNMTAILLDASYRWNNSESSSKQSD